MLSRTSAPPAASVHKINDRDRIMMSLAPRRIAYAERRGKSRAVHTCPPSSISPVGGTGEAKFWRGAGVHPAPLQKEVSSYRSERSIALCAEELVPVLPSDDWDAWLGEGSNPDRSMPLCV